MNSIHSQAKEIAGVIIKSRYSVAFTGAGISAESGIPPFRGEGGIWSRYNPEVLELDFFFRQSFKSWAVIKEIFYDFFQDVKPNAGHNVLAKWEMEGLLHALITQNIDNLHQKAGNHEVYEFHGTTSRLICTYCNSIFSSESVLLEQLPPRCVDCNGLLKPDFIFFGEGIPEKAYQQSIDAARKCKVFFIIGTSGEVSPANQIPALAKESGAVIIEINKEPSMYTNRISDYFLQGSAGEILSLIDHHIQSKKENHS
ncbi:MAG: NAD-dependent deacylase [Bacteroidales bacterium]|nr:NAD-dependent deacylase [Bacteroidales bacterium]